VKWDKDEVNYVRLTVFTAVTLLIMFFWVKSRVHWLVEANVSQKRPASIFRAEVMLQSCIHLQGRRSITSALKMEATLFFPKRCLLPTSSHGDFNIKEHHYKFLTCFILIFHSHFPVFITLFVSLFYYLAIHLLTHIFTLFPSF
jgi:hypothetical protein